jgi:hypothetical protein
MVLAILGAALGMGAASANAYVVHKSGSYPGTAQVPAVRVTGPGGYCDSTGCVIDMNRGYFTNQARTINENATYGSSWQYVTVTHRLWKYTPATFLGGVIYPGTWKVAQTSTRVGGWISPSQTAINTPSFSFAIGSLDSSYYATDVVITWQLQSGYQLGKKVYDYNARTDYSCDPGVCIVQGTADDGDAYIGL